MVHGPVPLTVVEATVAAPTAVALTLPVGFVQPAGTTTSAYELALKLAVSLRKLKVKLFPVLLGVVLPGETDMVPSPFASVNVPRR